MITCRPNGLTGRNPEEQLYEVDLKYMIERGELK